MLHMAKVAHTVAIVIVRLLILFLCHRLRTIAIEIETEAQTKTGTEKETGSLIEIEVENRTENETKSMMVLVVMIGTEIVVIMQMDIASKHTLHKNTRRTLSKRHSSDRQKCLRVRNNNNSSSISLHTRKWTLLTLFLCRWLQQQRKHKQMAVHSLHTMVIVRLVSEWTTKNEIETETEIEKETENVRVTVKCNDRGTIETEIEK